MVQGFNKMVQGLKMVFKVLGFIPGGHVGAALGAEIVGPCHGRGGWGGVHGV